MVFPFYISMLQSSGILEKTGLNSGIMLGISNSLIWPAILSQFIHNSDKFLKNRFSVDDNGQFSWYNIVFDLGLDS